MNARIAGTTNVNTSVNYNAYHSIEDISEESPPVTEPVALQDMKNYLRLEDFDETSPNPIEEFDFDDDLISSLITEARMWVEKFTWLHLIPKTLQVIVTCGEGMMSIPGPVTGDITTVDKNGNTVSGIEFLGSQFKKITTCHDYRLMLTYPAGYSQAPEWAINAIKAYVAWAYENRGDEDKKGSPDRAAAICRPHRRVPLWG